MTVSLHEGALAQKIRATHATSPQIKLGLTVLHAVYVLDLLHLRQRVWMSCDLLLLAGGTTRLLHIVLARYRLFLISCLHILGNRTI